jgi:heterogeneous nuclear ribonucleoprotein A1/A3
VVQGVYYAGNSYGGSEYGGYGSGGYGYVARFSVGGSYGYGYGSYGGGYGSYNGGVGGITIGDSYFGSSYLFGGK